MTALAVFLHPALLAAGAAAAAVPIVIHLLNRRRVRPLDWAAMTWLLAALKKHQRRLKMENWLVLFLRCAALALLGAGLARWVVSDSALTALARPKRTIVMLLDTSYSTGARTGARAVSDRVREVADTLLAGISADDVAAVVVSNDVRPDRTGTRPAVLLPRAVGRDAASRGRLELPAVRPTEAPAVWPDALAECSPKKLQLQAQDVNRVLVLVTDLQARDWRPPDDRATDPLRDAVDALRREGMELQVVDVGGDDGASLPNLVVTDLALADASDVFAGHGFQATVRVANFGTKPVARATLRLFLDDQPAPVKTLTIPLLPAADERTLAVKPVDVPVEVPRDVAPRTPGAHALRVEVTPPEGAASSDAVGLDSRRVLALDVRARLRIASWVEAPAKAAFDPDALLRGFFVGEGLGDEFEFDSVRSEEELRRLLLDPARRPGFVILGNRVPRNPETQRELASFVAEGGGLAVFPGADFDETQWNEAFGAATASRLLPFRFGPRETRTEGAWGLDFDRASPHPMSREFVAGEAHFVADTPPRLRGRLRLLPPEPGTTPSSPTPSVGGRPEDDLVVLRFKEGDGLLAGPAALVEGPVGLGRVMYAGFALDDLWTVEGYVLFLPVLLNDASLGMTRSSDVGRNLLVGAPIRASLPDDAATPRLSIPGRGEETPTLRAATAAGERRALLFDRVGTSGVWRLGYERPPERGTTSPTPRREEQVFGVNPDAGEGALLRAERAAVRGRFPGVELKVTSGLEEGAAQALAPVREGELTRWLLIAVLAILLLEPYLAMRFGRHDARGARDAAGKEAS